MAAPVHEPTRWILAALAGPRDGFGLIRHADQLSDAQVRLPAGTSYAALDRRTARGFVEVDRGGIVDGRPRRYYRLTSGGALRAGTRGPQAGLTAATAQVATGKRLGAGPARRWAR